MIERRRRSIAACDAHLRALLSWIDARLDEAGLSYSELARKIQYDRSWISRALSGRRVPPRPLVERIAAVTGGDKEILLSLWTAARDAATDVRRAHRVRRTDGHPPATMTTYWQLCGALRKLLHRRGISQRELVRRDQSGLLRRSTVGAVLRAQRSLPRDVTIAIVRACGVPEAAVASWAAEWDRLGWPYREAMERRRREIARHALRPWWYRGGRW